MKQIVSHDKLDLLDVDHIISENKLAEDDHMIRAASEPRFHNH